MAGNNKNPSQFLAPPTVAALREEARTPIHNRLALALDRSYSEDMRAEREDLREAAEQTLNVILDLGLDGRVKWVSPSWRQVVGTDPDSVAGKIVSDILWNNKTCFQDAVKLMKEDDSRSRFIRFSVLMGPDSMLKPSQTHDDIEIGELEGVGAGETDNYPNYVRKEDDGDVLCMEAQGIMIYDRSGDGEGHTMWMLRPSTSPREVTIDLPPLLVKSLGVGAEVLANHLTTLAERAADPNADKSVTPTPVLCRICERQITPWWFEKHSELCLQEHTAELEVQMAQDNLNEHRHAIVKILDTLEARQGRIPTDGQPAAPQPEYKGLPIGPSPSSSVPTSTPGSSPATPPRSRDPSTSGMGHGRGRSFAVRRPLARIVELILDLCDTALEISTPALKETRTDSIEDLRTLSPQSESRISQVLQWQSPSSNTLEQEQGLAALSTDTEQVAKAKVDAVVRHRRIVEYAERIRVEYSVMVEECMDVALSKAERIAAGDISDSSSSTSYGQEDEQLEQTLPDDEAKDQQENAAEAGAFLSQNPQADVPTRDSSDPSPFSQSPRRGSSVAVSTRSASPLECPTPRSHKSISGILGTSQPSIKRGSLLAESDIGDNSDSSSVPSSSLIAAGARVTESPSSEKGIPQTNSGRSRKRKSLILPNLSSSPRRQASPGRVPGPGSPLRLSKPRLPSGESMPSPSISPLLPTNELNAHGLPSQHHHHLHTYFHHRRQSSTASSDPRAPISPHLSSVSQPQPRPAPTSIKDFEVIKPISKGAFGSVYLAKKKVTGEYFAIKMLKKADMVAKNQVTNVKAERAIMMWQGESDFVAKLYWTFSSKDYLYLVMEYLNGGDCASLVKILGGLPEDWAKKYIAEVVLGVEHLHNRGIVHRDLKPDNLLIDQRGHLKLTDFGLSRMGLVGRQKRVLKSPNESAPDLLKQGSFPRAMSLVSSRSASFDFQGGHSPSSTPIIAPDPVGSYNQPSYFSLNQTTASRESVGRASGYRSDSGGSDTLNAMFRTFSLGEGAPETPALLPPPYQAVTEDEAPSEGGESPHLVPLSKTVSAASSSAMYGTPPQQSMLPPPMALFDPEDHNRRFVGTPDYLAPETINGVGQDDMSDWWSLGCILFEFLFGYPPFNAATPDEVFENILHRRINWPDEAQELVSPEALDLINRLMTIKPEERLGANIEEKYPNGGSEIRNHPWFSDINWDTLLEDKAEFVPNPENPEDTEYFDARGATLQSFEEIEDQASPHYPATSGEYPDRPHDALSKVRSQVNSIKRGLMPLHIPPHVRDTRSRRLSEPVLADDFGNFNFKNLPMLEKANKDVIQRLRQEALQAQQRQASSTAASPTVPSSAPSLEGSPLLPMPLQRTLSQNKGNRPVSPSGLSQSGSSPNRPSQPSSPLLVQFSTGQNHERRKTSGSSSAQSQQSVSPASDKIGEVPRLTPSTKLASSAPSPNKAGRLTTHSPEKTATGSAQPNVTRARSQTIGSQDSEGHSAAAREQFIPSHHKRRSQLFDISPSSSDNEDPRTKALLKVQRRRQSSRRLSQLNLVDGPVFRPLDILICEDHPVSRMVMERLFEKLRCRTITANNGSEAIRYALSEVQFDIIMTEVKLPQINGADVARMIRETRSANRHTPIIAVTGYLNDLPEAHHFSALIEKPPTLNKLTEALCKFCQWKPPPKDYVPTQPLMIPPPLPRSINQAEDSPSSISSAFQQIPSSSYRGSSRADSVGSSYFGDMESTRTEDIPVVVSRPPDNWGDTSEGLGISEGVSTLKATDTKPKSTVPNALSLPQLQHALSAPPTSTAPSRIAPRKQRSSEAIRAKRESLEKRRYEGAESGDDEDEELGNIQARQRGPHTSKGPRSSSKLGTEMMRTNSRGSVVSGTEEISSKEGTLEKLEVNELGEQLSCFRLSPEIGSDNIALSGQDEDRAESPRSSRSPDQFRRPTLEPLHEYPTEIRSPSVLEASVQPSTAKLFTPSKEYNTEPAKSPQTFMKPSSAASEEQTDSESIDPDATPRPAPTPAMSELDNATPRGPGKSRSQTSEPSREQNAGDGRTSHHHFRDLLSWGKR